MEQRPIIFKVYKNRKLLGFEELSSGGWFHYPKENCCDGDPVSLGVFPFGKTTDTDAYIRCQYIRCQYIGLDTSKGVKIFEGDIVKVDNVPYPCLVVWNSNGFFGNFYGGEEVLGNIFENPDLLK